MHACEIDTADNVKEADSMVTVLSHDVAVKEVTPSKTIVLQGFSASINVTVENQGDYTETFNVTVYANTILIAAFENTILTRRDSATITFTWNTTGWAKGVYTISANASTVPGETDTTDNTKIGGTVRVTMAGDLRPEWGVVNIIDIAYVAIHFDAEKGEPEYEPNADINGDGFINILDVVMVGIYFGETDP